MRHRFDTRFGQIIPLVLNAEGGYVDHPDDPGGPTNFGIAANKNRVELRALGVDDVRELTLDEAKEIYYLKYWLPAGCQEIPDIRLAYIHFDAAVNCGVQQAAKFMSRLSADPKHYQGNGKNERLFHTLFLEYFSQRLRFYTKLKNRKAFLEGWVNRMAGLAVAATTLHQGGTAA